jgi:hypothetical protein
MQTRAARPDFLTGRVILIFYGSSMLASVLPRKAFKDSVFFYLKNSYRTQWISFSRRSELGTQRAPYDPPATLAGLLRCIPRVQSPVIALHYRRQPLCDNILDKRRWFGSSTFLRWK